MANPQKRKGDAAEREAAQLLSDLLGLVVRRKLGAGRTTTAGGDTGDLDGVPAHVIQVASWANTAAAARLKPDEAALQAEHDRLYRKHALLLARVAEVQQAQPEVKIKRSQLLVPKRNADGTVEVIIGLLA